MARIAICTNTYNQRDCVHQLIANRNDCRDKQRRFYIRDDVSTDDTFELYSSFACADIEVVQNPKNLGSRLNSISVLENCRDEFYLCKGGDD